MRIVLRNTSTRLDAVYVLDGTGFGSVYWLTGYWGRWPGFLRDGVFGLRKQEKYCGPAKADLIRKVQEIVSEKLAKGYRVQEDVSRLPQWPIMPYGQDWREHESV